MEIVALLEACGCFLELLSASGAIADVVAISKSRQNRKERREAKLQGQQKPPRDGWNWTVLFLTPFLLLLLAIAALKYYLWFRGG